VLLLFEAALTIDTQIVLCYSSEHETQNRHYAYSLNKVIDKLTNDGMSVEEAFEFYEFNQLGAWVGDTTPCYIDTLEE